MSIKMDFRFISKSSELTKMADRLFILKVRILNDIMVSNYYSRLSIKSSLTKSFRVSETTSQQSGEKVIVYVPGR